ncbi:MAG TPA: hypothetical protein GX519_06875 [Thermoanaerobacterales bacterium]|nr:hypothetical protein [Thermoanaerobacterales bacterium]
MKQKDLRTYKRRSVTRTSGFHTCDETTGGECLIKKAQAFNMHEDRVTFKFRRSGLVLTELFDKGNGMLAFGGYIYTNKPLTISFLLKYTMNGRSFEHQKDYMGPVNVNDWNNIGFHKEISSDYGETVELATVEMTIRGEANTCLQFISFDFGPVSKEEYIGDVFGKPFYQKTAMHIPYLYYLETTKPFDTYLLGNIELSSGNIVVLKSCNRCGRYLPINIFNEVNTLSFSLHCKKRAPCVHSTFRAYNIQNMDDVSMTDLKQLQVENGKVVSYHGHQLECKACKKFFVNAPLNPQRNPQQFKEDGLRRRAIEVLVNRLLDRNLVHFEFEHRTKKEFSEYIWKKFGGRCFKCNKKMPLDEMHLDHTMPLAYLYRLDESATCLCGTHNAQKSDRFPSDYYTEDELEHLSKITGLSLDVLKSKGVNQTVLKLLVDNVVWFYDEFLKEPEYQKIRGGIRTADKINDSLKRVIEGQVDLAEEYRSRTGKYPTTVTIVKTV